MKKNTITQKVIFFAIVFCIIFISTGNAGAATLTLPDYGEPAWNGPLPGTVYKEYSVLSMNISPSNIIINSKEKWRVTDPNADFACKNVSKDVCPTETDNQNCPACFLPNVKFKIPGISTANAIKAELYIDQWGGHAGTTGRAIIINDHQLELPLNYQGTPLTATSYVESYLGENILKTGIPLNILKNNQDNIFQFTSGKQLKYQIGPQDGWGQWGWYDMRLRVYYNPSSINISGQITSPAQNNSAVGENPTITAAATAAAGVEKVEFFGVYYGADESGEGIYYDIHEMFHKGSLLGNIGSDSTAPYSVTWNTDRVPNQKKNSIKFFARIKDSNGFWFVTQPKIGISLNRPNNKSVIMLPATSVPEKMMIRNNETYTTKFSVPSGLDLPSVSKAEMYLRSWNLNNDDQGILPYKVNNISSDRSVDGPGYDFNLNFFELNKNELRSGDNTIAFTSTTEHHGAEILWPGPTIVLTSSQPVKYSGDWTDLSEATGDFYTIVSVKADGTKREEKVVDVPLNITEKLLAQNKQGRLEKISGVAEIDSSGNIIDSNVPFQFDPDVQFNNITKTSGNLVLLLKGITQPAQERRFKVSVKLGGDYTNSANSNNPTLITLSENETDEGQDSFKIQTPSATYFYHKFGGGFSSIIDKNDQDWLNYHIGSGSAGEYRGIPNMVFVSNNTARSFFHPGFTNSTSAITNTGKLKTTLETQSNDGRWKARWEFYPQYAKMTLLERKSLDKYWFLYEGTPGGNFNSNNTVVRSSGTATNLSTSWEGDLAEEEWVYFTSQGKSLFAAHHEDDSVVEGYHQMENNMTVFGFGRKSTGADTQMTAAPATFSIGLIDTTQFDQAKPLIQAAYKNMNISSGPLQPSNGATPSAPQGLSVK